MLSGDRAFKGETAPDNDDRPPHQRASGSRRVALVHLARSGSHRPAMPREVARSSISVGERSRVRTRDPVNRVHIVVRRGRRCREVTVRWQTRRLFHEERPGARRPRERDRQRRVVDVRLPGLSANGCSRSARQPDNLLRRRARRGWYQDCGFLLVTRVFTGFRNTRFVFRHRHLDGTACQISARLAGERLQ